MCAATSIISITTPPFRRTTNSSNAASRRSRLDWRWPFVSDSGNGSYVLEPIGQAIYQPYGGNPAGIPNEDSTSSELDENNLFSFDPLPGYDIVESGPRFNAGLRADAIYPIAHFEALVGESFRLKPDPIFAGDSGLSGTQSDIVGRFSIKFPPYIDLTHRIGHRRAHRRRAA
ncbi:MAG: LPS assembly protein LptD [Rhizomicrobium sp.]